MKEKLTENQLKSIIIEEIREYLIINDIEISAVEDFKETYLKMRSVGYFHKAISSDRLDAVRQVFSDLAEAYEKDKSIIESDLIFFGARKVLEKMNNKVKR